MDESLWIGLMSGTSADGIDAALVRFGPRLEVLASETSSYPDALRQKLLELAQGTHELSLDAIAELDHQVGACFADAALRMLGRAQRSGGKVAAIGSHGQTLRHRPQGKHPFTLQIGDPNLISERCGCTVVADFRRRDVAAGGQGAPLLPALHAAIFADAGEDRAVLNLGGIANLTLLPVGAEVRGFDTGPANCLLDAWCAEQTGSAFDRDGGWAASGKVVDALLAACLEEPWFALAPPKSTGREMFHLDWLRQRWPALTTLASADVQATLLALTVRSVTDALLREQPDTRRLLVCGGGVHNPQLLQGLRTLLPGVTVESTARHGVDPDSVEAAGFAWLARERLAGRPGNLPSVTGAAGPRVLGAIYSA